MLPLHRNLKRVLSRGEQQPVLFSNPEKHKWWKNSWLHLGPAFEERVIVNWFWTGLSTWQHLLQGRKNFHGVYWWWDSHGSIQNSYWSIYQGHWKKFTSQMKEIWLFWHQSNKRSIYGCTSLLQLHLIDIIVNFLNFAINTEPKGIPAVSSTTLQRDIEGDVFEEN